MVLRAVEKAVVGEKGQILLVLRASPIVGKLSALAFAMEAQAQARSDGHHAGQKPAVRSWKEETDAMVEAMSGSQSSGMFSWGDDEHEE